MLADWAFCCALRLPPQQTAVYLDILASLRSWETLDELDAALSELVKAEPWIVQYALPLAFEAVRQLQGDHQSEARVPDRFESRQQEHVARLIELVVRGADDRRLRDDLSRLARGALVQGRDTETLLRRLDDVVRAGAVRNPNRVPHDIYLDLPEFMPEVMLLSVLLARAHSDPETVALLCSGDGRLATVAEALAGGFGRYAMLLAARTVARVAPEEAERQVERLWQADTGRAEIEPDLMAATVEMLFPAPAGDLDEWLDEVESEALTGLRLRGFWRRDVGDWGAHEDAHERLYGGPATTDRNRRRALPLMLWNCLLWSHAAQVAPDPVAVRLARWWQPPRTGGKTIRAGVKVPLADSDIPSWRAQTAALLQLRRRRPDHRVKVELDAAHGEVAETSPEDGSTLMSPWLWRRNVRDLRKYKTDEEGRETGETVKVWVYPQSSDGQMLIRLLTATITAVHLMRRGAGKEHLVELVLHAGDVLGGSGFRQYLIALKRNQWEGDHPLPLPVAGLALFTKHLVERVGKGLYESIPPESFVRLLTDADAVGGRPEESAKLRTIAGPMVVCRWVEDLASGTGGRRYRRSQGRWLLGQPPLTRQVVSTAIDRARTWIRENPVPPTYVAVPYEQESAELLAMPVLLARQGGERLGFDATEFDEALWDWRRTLAEQNGIEWREVLLTATLSLAEWQQFSFATLPGIDRDAGGRIAFATERLAALLAAGPSGATPETEHWLAEWLRSIAHVSDPLHLPRAIRLRFADFLNFQITDPGPVMETWRRATEMILYLTAEFGANTLWHYKVVFDALSKRPEQFADTFGELRYRWMHAVLQHRSAVMPEAGPRSPWDVLEIRDEPALIETMARSFVHAVGEETFTWEAESLGTKLAALWAKTRLERPFTLVRQSASQLTPMDLRDTVAVIRNWDTGTVHRLVGSESKIRSRSGREVKDLFAATAPDEQAEPEFLALGIVGGAADDGRTYDVNCGLSDPVTVGCSERLRIGDPIAVPMSGSRPLPWQEPEPMALVPKGTDVRMARLTLAADRSGDEPVNVAVDGYVGHGQDADPELLARRWDPDLSRVFTRKRTEVLAREAIWSAADDVWLPVDRTFLELLAAGLRFKTADDRPAEVFTCTGPGPEGPTWSWRLTTEPGVCYLVTEEDWEAESLHRLLGRLEPDEPEEGIRPDDARDGLLLYAETVVEEDGTPRLRLLTEPPQGGAEDQWPKLSQGPFDERNIRWRRLFADERRSVIARYVENFAERPDGPGGPAYVVHCADLVPDELSAGTALAEMGFPSEVTLALGSATTAALRCTISADEQQLRTRRVTYRPTGDREIELNGRTLREAYDAVHGLGRGTIQRLKRGSWGQTGNRHRVRALTTDGLDVLVNADSLSLRPGPIRAGLLNDREIEVTHCPFEQPVHFAEVPHTRLTDAYQACAPVDAHPTWQWQGEVEGLICRWPADTENPSATCGVWLDLGDAIAAVDLPLRECDPDGGSVGDRLRLTRSGGRWRVQVIRRRVIFAVARWTVSRQLRRRDSQEELWHAEVAGADKIIVQSVAEPVLTILPVSQVEGQEIGHAGHQSMIDRAARVTVTARSQPYRGTVRVEAAAGKERLFGTADDFGGGDVRLDDVFIIVSERDGGTRAVVERRLSLTTVARAARGESQPAYRKEIYEKWLRGDGHCLAGLKGGQARLYRLYLAAGPGRFVDTVTLGDPEPAWVSGMGYSTGNARVRLNRVGGRWTASCRDAEPYDVADFVQRMCRGGEARGAHKQLQHRTYYAGSVELQNGERAYRFEWGYGRTALIPQSALTLQGAPMTDGNFPMFFGDRLRSARFTERGGGHVIDIDAERDIDWQVNVFRAIYEEARRVKNGRMLFAVRPAVRGRSIGVGEVRRQDRRPEITGEKLHHYRRDRVSHRPVKLRVMKDGKEDAEGLERLREILTDEQHDGKWLLATLDQKSFDESRGEEVAFCYARDFTKGDHLFMVVDGVEELFNDILVNFRLPDDVLLTPEMNDLSVTVNRRDFSNRESMLRLYCQRDGGQALLGRPVLVKILRESNRPARSRKRPPRRGRPARAGSSWQGSMMGALFRPYSLLVDYVRANGGTCLAVVGAPLPNSRVVLEIKPGVFFSYGYRNDERPGLVTGAIVRLTLNDQHIAVRPAISGDRKFIPEDGRAAVVLPKSNLIKRQIKVAGINWSKRFTVGGLPGVEVSPPRRLAERIMRVPHPKVALVDRTWEMRDPGRDLPVGYIHVDGHLKPSARPLRMKGDAVQLDWAQLSYRDCGARELNGYLEKPAMRYHDQHTGHWVSVDPQTKTATTKSVALSAENAPQPPFFFQETTGGWSLRYRHAGLRGWSYPATSLVEDRDGGESKYFPVAAVLRDGTRQAGLWVELSPGHIVEISGGLLVPESGRPLDAFSWNVVSPGDLVRIERRAAHRYEPDLLVLSGWEPGPRGLLHPRSAAEERALLPISAIDGDALGMTLGSGQWRLVRPGDPGELEKHAEGDAVWLHGDNRLVPDDASPLRPNDVVSVQLRDGRLVLPGDRSERPGCADEKAWPSSMLWLRTTLQDADSRSRLLELCGGSLPLTVVENRGGAVALAWPGHPGTRIGRGRTVYGRLLGWLDDRRLLVRCGSALVRLDAEELVPNLPPELVKDVVRKLSAKWSLSLHCDQHGRMRVGFPHEMRPGTDVVVRPLEVVEGQGRTGVVCQDHATGTMFWMPADQAGWVPGLTAPELRTHLDRLAPDGDVTRIDLKVVYREDGTVSRTGLYSVARRLEAFQPGDQLRVFLDSDEPRSADDVSSRYLARTYLTDLPVELQIPNDLMPGKDREATAAAYPFAVGSLLTVEVARSPSNMHDGLLVAPIGMRRVHLDVPRWLPDKKVPEEFASYPRCFDAGRAGTTMGTLSPHEGILWAAGHALATAGDTEADLGDLIARLRVWLLEQGPGAFGEEEAELDVAPMLAAILALARLEGHGAPASGPASVHLMWQMGLRAQRSLHIETLLRYWLPDKLPATTVLGKRLSLMPFNRSVDMKERQQILAFARAVLSRVPDEDFVLPAIAHSLRMTVCEPSSEWDPLRHAEILARLVPFGRALIPAADRVTAQSKLRPAQIRELQSAFEQLLRSRIPLTSLAPVNPMASGVDDLRRRLIGELGSLIGDRSGT